MAKESLKEPIKYLGFFIIIAGLIIPLLILGGWLNIGSSNIDVGFIGLETFSAVLVGMFFITDKWDFTCGEFRKAITVSIIFVFFSILAFGNGITITPNGVLNGFFNNFWAIVATVISFYFASRVIDTRTNSK